MQLRDRIKRHESFRPFVYDDATGKELKPGDTVKGTPTFGYGFTRVDAEESEMMLDRRIAAATRDARDVVLIFDNLDRVRRDALIEMAYQLGGPRFSGFKRMIAAVNMRDWQAAYEEALDSRWAEQTPSRAHEIAGMLLTGNKPAGG